MGHCEYERLFKNYSTFAGGLWCDKDRTEGLEGELMTFTIPGSIRSKKNSKQIIKAKGRHIPISSKAYHQWEQDAWKELRPQIPSLNFPLSHQIHIKATFYYKGPRPDLHGAMESLADCLQHIIINDDRQVESWDGTRMVHDKDNPRTEFEVRQYE